MNRGEVWWARSSSGKRRPFLILTRQVAIPLLHSVIAVPATSRIRNIPTEVKLGKTDGMPRSCALSVDNITLMPKTLFTNKICRLKAHKMNAVCHALTVAAGC